MTNQELLQLLVERVPPPERPDRADGTTLNGRYGPNIALPDDYRLFLDVYGPGAFAEGDYPEWWVFDLVTDADRRTVDMVLERTTGSHRMFPDMFPPAYPTVPGLLPWGYFQSVRFYWWVDGPPNSWRVHIDPPVDVYRENYSMLEFLAVNFDLLPGVKFYSDEDDEDGYEIVTGFFPRSRART